MVSIQVDLVMPVVTVGVSKCGSVLQETLSERVHMHTSFLVIFWLQLFPVSETQICYQEYPDRNQNTVACEHLLQVSEPSHSS